MVLACEEESFATERRVSALFLERDGLHQQSLELSMKYDDALISMEGEQSRMKHQHKLHCKLLAMRHLEENLQAIKFRILESNFRHLLSATDVKKHRFGAIELFKGILEGNGRAKVKRYM
jgi:hypothetical protein